MGSFGQWQFKRQLGRGGFGNVHYWRNGETGEEIGMCLASVNWTELEL